MPRKRREVDAALHGKGFAAIENDHTWFVYHAKDGGITRARTKLSHGSGGQDISDSLLARMAKQVRLSSADFRRLIDCPLSRENYEKLLRQQGELPDEEVL